MKRQKRRFKSESEIIELIDKYKAELKTMKFSDMSDERAIKKAIAYRMNRLSMLKNVLAEFRTMMLNESDFGDCSVPEHKL